MKTLTFKTLVITSGLVSLTAFYGASALADEDLSSLENTLTREQVRADYFEAVKDGSLPIYNEGVSGEPLIATEAPSTLTREAVYAETIEWLRASQVDVQMGGN